MKTKFFAITAIILAVAAGLAVTVYAQGHGRHGWMMNRMTRELNLTETQQAQIKSIMQTEHAKIQPLMQQLRQNRQANEANLTANFDEAKARAFAAGQAQIMTDLMVEKQRAKSQIFAVLTPEQRQKAQELKQQRLQRRQQWMQKHQQQPQPSSEQ